MNDLTNNFNVTVDTHLPIFSGFYGSIFEDSGLEVTELDYINEIRFDKGLKEYKNCDSFIFDYESYYKEIANNYCNIIESHLKDIGLNCNIVFKGISSPREYNFTNDKINIEISFNFYSFYRLFLKNITTISDHFKEQFTNRDGFRSYYSPYIQVWIDNLKSNDMDYYETYHFIRESLQAILTDKLTENEINDIESFDGALNSVCLNAKNFNELIGGANND